MPRPSSASPPHHPLPLPSPFIIDFDTTPTSKFYVFAVCPRPVESRVLSSRVEGRLDLRCFAAVLSRNERIEFKRLVCSHIPIGLRPKSVVPVRKEALPKFVRKRQIPPSHNIQVCEHPLAFHTFYKSCCAFVPGKKFLFKKLQLIFV